jgi:hypothetical protein
MNVTERGIFGLTPIMMAALYRQTARSFYKQNERVAIIIEKNENGFSILHFVAGS